MSNVARLIDDGQAVYDFVCEGCRCEGEMKVPTSQRTPFACPEGCGATYIQWKDAGAWKLQCVVCPVFEDEVEEDEDDFFGPDFDEYDEFDDDWPEQDPEDVWDFDYEHNDFEERVCRLCGCTQDDCEQCVARTGTRCAWAEPDLCTACTQEALIEQIMELTGMTFDHPDFDACPNDDPSELFFTVAGNERPDWLPEWMNGADLEEVTKGLLDLGKIDPHWKRVLSACAEEGR